MESNQQSSEIRSTRHMTSKQLSRRSFLSNTARATGGVITLGVLSRRGVLDAQEATPFEYAWQNLNAHQGRTVDALTRMIMPSDDNGPGAAEARVIVYIDRALGATGPTIGRPTQPAWLTSICIVRVH
jgi:hypothetical protein